MDEGEGSCQQESSGEVSQKHQKATGDLSFFSPFMVAAVWVSRKKEEEARGKT